MSFLKSAVKSLEASNGLMLQAQAELSEAQSLDVHLLQGSYMKQALLSVADDVNDAAQMVREVWSFFDGLRMLLVGHGDHGLNHIAAQLTKYQKKSKKLLPGKLPKPADVLDVVRSHARR